MASAFSGRTLLIATKHGKESVIAPVLEKELGVRCIVAADLDTDILGTFTGEIEREGDALSTVRKKCQLAMAMYGCDLAVASEGSFGPHPSAYFLSAGDELLMCVDAKQDLEIVTRDLSTDTNFAAQEVHSLPGLMQFAERVGFPEHALILRRSRTDRSSITKGIRDTEQLRSVYKHLRSTYGQAFVETDMRAMMNPTRMRSIEKAARQLAQKMLNTCPVCTTPGFSITEAISGLPCGWCGTPTKSVAAHIYQCKRCGHQEKVIPAGLQPAEDPMYCDICNP